MDVGDRVVYILNNEVDLNRDTGTLTGWDHNIDREFAEVAFDDGETWTVARIDIRPLIDKR